MRHKIYTSQLRILFVLLLSAQIDLFALKTESPHFIYYYEEQDSSIIDTIILRLENNYDRILSDLEITLSSKTVIRIYPTLQDFHNAIGWPAAPDWLVGVGFTQVQVVSPLNPGPVHSYNSIMNNVILHEFVHVCTAKLNTNLPAWISEGFALFEAGPYYSKSSVINSYQNLGRIPLLDELSDRDFFNNNGGYPFSLTIFYFINDKLGMDTIPVFIKYPDDFSVFNGISRKEFEELWHTYFKEKYLGISNTDESSNPQVFLLHQNYPNPFNSETTISYQLPSESNVEIKIFDSSGKMIENNLNGNQDAGMYDFSFNSNNLSSGIYLYQLKAASLKGNVFLQTRKMVLLK